MMKKIALGLLVISFCAAFAHWSDLVNVEKNIDLATLYMTKAVFWFLVFRFGFDDKGYK